MAKRRRQAASITDLENAIARAEERIAGLEKKRANLLAQVGAVDAEIASLKGEDKPAPTPAAPAPKAKKKSKKRVKAKRGRKGTLVGAIANALKAADSPMKVADIAKAVVKAGYKTKSKNVPNLIREALTRVPRIKKVSRGQYTMK
ncbi:MAG: hypothetical protein HQ582_00820 [Planctomycetes bacterium]|nr:hypothetical protein [Planctomycetota bacterium]